MGSAREIANLTVESLAAGVTSGKIDPVGVVHNALTAIDQSHSLNAVITACPEAALERARAPLGGPLAGAPLLVKDIFDTRDLRTTYGSAIFRDNIPKRTAEAVRRAEQAGAVVVGKANLHEFAWGTTSQNPHYGFVQNPVEPGKLAGGSSGGNAAALAANLCAIGIGTDTGGSARGPSACCRTVGFKPPTGTVPTDGCFPFAPSLDTVAPMARSVADCELLYSVLSGRPRAAARAKGLVIAVLTTPPRVSPDAPLVTSSAARRAEIEQRAGEFEELGANVVELELPEPTADLLPIVQAEAAITHRGLYPARRDEYGADTQAKLDAARSVTAIAVYEAKVALEVWRERVAVECTPDLVICPTLANDVPPVTAREQDVRDELLAFTRPFNFLDWAAIAVGQLQITGRDETVVLGAALAWEEAHPSSDLRDPTLDLTERATQ